MLVNRSRSGVCELAVQTDSGSDVSLVRKFFCLKRADMPAFIIDIDDCPPRVHVPAKLHALEPRRIVAWDKHVSVIVRPSGRAQIRAAVVFTIPVGMIDMRRRWCAVSNRSPP